MMSQSSYLVENEIKDVMTTPFVRQNAHVNDERNAAETMG